MRSFVLVTAAVAAVTLALPGRERPISSPRVVGASRAEVARLRAHFDSVDRELRARDVSDLPVSQRAARARLVRWLREYSDAGAFPQNDRFADRAMPFFRDTHGTLCAMAYLIARSGRVDLVDRVAETNNNAFIGALAGDSALRRWLDSVGLTLNEAARVQPTYGPRKEGVGTTYAVASTFVSGGALVSAGFNVAKPGITSGVFGLLTGAAAGLIGLAETDSKGDTKTLSTVNLVIGASSMVLGVRGVVVALNQHARKRSGASSAASQFVLSIMPSVQSGTTRPGIGLALHARF